MTINYETLREVARDIFKATGLAADKAEAVARYLVEADLMGHTTHGLALAPWYLQSLRDGVMAADGIPETVSDRGAAICWRGLRLPGAWLVSTGVALCMERARQYGTATLVIGDSHHIGALAAYLPDATAEGFMISIASSSPSGAQVAPFGGLKGVFTPDPVAYGIPTPGDPILIDISASITTVNMAQRMIQEGRSYEHPWVMDAEGALSTDPNAVIAGGSLLPTGGLDHGQKGYGMALAVEALTQGLAGYGRADTPKGTNAAVMITVHDPDAFGGQAAFLRQTGWLANACLASPPRDPSRPVRLPGQAALARRRKAMSEGVELYPSIIPALKVEAERLGVDICGRL
ncbi:lactate dehydrogenase [Brucella endophytica]|uniref:Lactate dehydrogenase n=1 Tax=Brucella endophytica TaxID=1963359 RepID=A0A916SM47_9HYPH|nr:Ldh family oxidoreductase [Brucella endophytica]GGB06119.1 lactate dehydrogenase [Brucella endophytica]